MALVLVNSTHTVLTTIPILVVFGHNKLPCTHHMRYLAGGILAAKAACLALVLGDGGATGRGVTGRGVEDEWARALGELKDKDWGLVGGTGTGVFGGTEGPTELGEGPGKLTAL